MALFEFLRRKPSNGVNNTPQRAVSFQPHNLTVEHIQFEYRTKQVLQLVATALPVAIYANYDIRVLHSFKKLFVSGPLLMSYLIAGNFVQVGSVKNPTRNVPSDAIPTAGEVWMFFHALRVLDDAFPLKILSVKRSYLIANLLGYVLQTVFQAYT